MEERVQGILLLWSPLLISLNYKLKFPLGDLWITVYGMIFAVFLAVLACLMKIDLGLRTTELKCGAFGVFVIVGGYCGYSASIAIEAYKALGVLGPFYLINSLSCSVFSIAFFIVFIQPRFKHKAFYLYSDADLSLKSLFITSLSTFSLSEILGNTLAVFSGTCYLTLTFLIQYITYNLLTIISLLIAFGCVLRQYFFRKKIKFYMR